MYQVADIIVWYMLLYPDIQGIGRQPAAGDVVDGHLVLLGTLLSSDSMHAIRSHLVKCSISIVFCAISQMLEITW